MKLNFIASEMELHDFKNAEERQGKPLRKLIQEDKWFGCLQFYQRELKITNIYSSGTVVKRHSV